ncbi:hypothetical protein ACLKA6_009971 [Drosophila palustris]
MVGLHVACVACCMRHVDCRYSLTRSPQLLVQYTNIRIYEYECCTLKVASFGYDSADHFAVLVELQSFVGAVAVAVTAADIDLKSETETETHLMKWRRTRSPSHSRTQKNISAIPSWSLLGLDSLETSSGQRSLKR